MELYPPPGITEISSPTGSAPPLNRRSMAPRPWPAPAAEQGPLNSPAAGGALPRGAMLRRLVLLLLVALQTALATNFMRGTLPYHGSTPLELAILTLFGVLFLWLSLGFWTAVTGFAVLMRGEGRTALRSGAPAGLDEHCRTALVMPICNEDVARTFAGLRATCLSLLASGAMRHFDIFILSDTGDAAKRAAEHAAWKELSDFFGSSARIHYRWRRHHIKRKSGNIADFCRRWGANYRYMVVLDADSVMTGDCLRRLVGLMEANPSAGIIQTAPCAVGRDTLHARIQQFAGRLYGPMFAAGMHFWQLGESHYWGHNAIIRVAPFMRHCALGRIRGRDGSSWEILSHDFVEAAMMRRAGWAVWVAYDLPGSYEETPPNLIEELKRDRRWCHGNLINLRLIALPGIRPVHRLMFAMGALSYASSLLWLLFLVCSMSLLASFTLSLPEYFSMPSQLFPNWPQWHPERALTLLSATATLLFAPKLLAVALAVRRGAARFGGVSRLLASVVLEALFSALLAPVRMVFHSWFVFSALVGHTAQWRSPPREDTQTLWRDAWRHHGLHTVMGSVWAYGAYRLSPDCMLWLMPILAALLLAVPISVLSSRVSIGCLMRRAGLFLTPEEIDPPREWRWTQLNWNATPWRAPTAPESAGGDIRRGYAHAPE